MQFRSRICTTKEQSERLLALGLKKETADMTIVGVFIGTNEDGTLAFDDVPNAHPPMLKKDLPAWSLHRLLFLIPEEVNIDGFKFPLRSDAIRGLEDADYMYERLIGIIERVIEQGYFNKDYLEEKK